ncbi:hypothetical protein D3H65_06445 [Paraflavitalea soli]|uniref:Uncharacterized protein n=1 Tax=Paraflavitalea soli TaxID=2315862 RepID=A0A3B7MT23_9BACT|nr:hypothetical protein [Paraflavitalea soli]AXY73641.1 hypothetical protein D3H65_06445 [Paraflavitalea soli]
MTRTTLKFIRLLVPGLILVLEFLPLLKFAGQSYKINDGWLSYSYLTLIAVGIGAFYHINNARYFVTNASHKRIDLNIMNSLLKLYPKTLTQAQHNFLKEKKRLKNIFYNFIDNDKSLTAKSENVYFNGALWTSTADAFIISTFSSIIYLIAGTLFFKQKEVWLWGILFGGIALIAILLHLLTIFKHINIGNDQLEFIETNKLKELETKIDEILQQLP